MRKPTLAVWAINQLARQEQPLIRELIQTHRSLAKVSGAAKMQEVTRERRKLVSTLTQKAEELLTDAGHSATDQTIKRIGATLLAITTTEDQDLLKKGRLTTEATAGGFEGAFGQFAPSEEEDDDGSAQARADAEKEAGALAAEARQAEEEAESLAAAAERLRLEAKSAEDEARSAKHRARELQKEAKTAALKANRL